MSTLRDTKNMKKYHYIEKYNSTDAGQLQTLDHKIHYKLYMIYTKYGYDYNGSHIDGNHTSLKRLAELMGVSRQQFSKYIRPTNPETPDIYNLFKFSQATHIPFEYLVDDTIECSESYTIGTKQQRETANRQLCKTTLSKFLKDESYSCVKVWNTFSEETGLNGAFLQRLTESAKEDFFNQIKELVDNTLSRKENLYIPMNPVDDEYIDYIEGEGLCQTM